jgi:hypothetical protein
MHFSSQQGLLATLFVAIAMIVSAPASAEVTGINTPAATTPALPQPLYLGTGGAVYMTISPSGNIGMGLQNPGVALQIVGANTGYNQSNPDGTIMIVDDGNSRAAITVGGGVDGSLLIDNVASALYVHNINGTGRSITTSGTIAIGGVGNSSYMMSNLGIGSSTPSNKLDVFSTSDYSTQNLQSNAGLRVDDGANDTAALIGVETNSGNHTTYIQSMQPQVSWANRPLVLQPLGGNVGVGVSVPTAQLDVNGGIRGSNSSIVAGSPCTPEGMIGYDLTDHQPVYCSQSSVWTDVNAMSAFLNRKWHNVLGSRSLNVAYANSNSYPVDVFMANHGGQYQVVVTSGGASVTLFCGADIGAGWTQGDCTFTVPPGGSYEIPSGTVLGGAWQNWDELY